MPRAVTSFVLVPVLAVAVVSFAVVAGHDGDGDSLVSAQQQTQGLNPATVERGVVAAPDPVAEPTHARGVAATCSSLGTGGLLNPWRCSIRYPSGRQVQYLVSIHADGSYRGDHEIVRYRRRRYPDTGTITGCCVSVP